MSKTQIPELPDYNNCLVNLANSIEKKFGVETTADTLPLADKYLDKKYKNVVVLLLDAMGISILEKHLKEDGFFRSHLAGEYNSVYPPTTVAATTSLMNGLYPDEHGWLGWDMYIPDLDKNVTLFRNVEQSTEKEGAEPTDTDPEGKRIWGFDSIQEGSEAADHHVGYNLLDYMDGIVRRTIELSELDQLIDTEDDFDTFINKHTTAFGMLNIIWWICYD